MDEQGINGPSDPNNPGVALDDAVAAAIMPGADGAAMAPAVEDSNEPEGDDPSGSR
jgi:hypothetical protein